MNYFLVQGENQLTHLPDCQITEGKREIVEMAQIGGSPMFARGRKQPDLCVFSVPNGVSAQSSYVIVDENGLVRRVLASVTEITSHRLLAAGVVEDQYEAPHLKKAKKIIAEKLKEIA